MTSHRSSSRFITNFVDSVTTRPLLDDLLRMRTGRRFWTLRVRESDWEPLAMPYTGRQDEAA